MEEFVERTDPKGKKYFWLTGKFVNYDKADDTDEQALSDHYVSIVPIKYDLTDYNIIEKINKLL